VSVAVIVVDMIRDNVETPGHLGMAREAKAIIPGIQRLLVTARQKGWLVVFACDSFLPGDFIFQGRMRPHALRGTPGVEVIDELRPQRGEMVMEKRRMSAFFRTDLDLTLQVHGIRTVVVAGISTPVCVLMTALDAVSHGFRAVILEDCCAAHSPEVHQATVDLYRNTALRPLLSVLTLDQLISSDPEP